MLEYNLPKFGNIYTTYNIQVENNLSLPLFFNHMGHFNYSKEYFTTRKDLDSYILFFTIEGAGKIIYSNKEVILKEHEVAILNCSKYHHYETYADKWNFKWIHFEGSFIEKMEQAINNKTFHKIKPSNPNMINGLLEEIHTLASQKDIYLEYRFNNIMTKILTELYLDHKKAENNIASSPFLTTNTHRFIDYVKSNYINPISVEAFCDNHNISKYKFIRSFKNSTSFTPYKFVTNYRISKAKQFLRNLDLTVSEISYMVGYNDPNVFIRSFKKVTNSTPDKYRTFLL